MPSDPVGPQLTANFEKIKARVQKALDASAKQFGDNVLEQGRQDITGAGNFGSRWTAGFTYDVGGSGNVRIVTFRHAVPYWRVFQYGALIQAKSGGLLWIPLPGVSRDERGDFFQTSKKGNRLLFKKVGKEIVPLRVGKEEVTIPKKFHLIEIVRAESQTLGALFRLEMASD
jgi:hypothetical protein